LADPSSLTPSPPLLKISFLRRMTPSAPRTSTPAPEASWNLLLEMAVKSPVRVRAVSAPRAFTSNPTKSTFLATISHRPKDLGLIASGAGDPLQPFDIYGVLSGEALLVDAGGHQDHAEFRAWLLAALPGVLQGRRERLKVSLGVSTGRVQSHERSRSLRGEPGLLSIDIE
jgi:hypothetical protein